MRSAIAGKRGPVPRAKPVSKVRMNVSSSRRFSALYVMPALRYQMSQRSAIAMWQAKRLAVDKGQPVFAELLILA